MIEENLWIGAKTPDYLVTGLLTGLSNIAQNKAEIAKFAREQKKEQQEYEQAIIKLILEEQFKKEQQEYEQKFREQKKYEKQREEQKKHEQEVSKILLKEQFREKRKEYDQQIKEQKEEERQQKKKKREEELQKEERIHKRLLENAYMKDPKGFSLNNLKKMQILQQKYGLSKQIEEFEKAREEAKIYNKRKPFWFPEKTAEDFLNKQKIPPSSSTFPLRPSKKKVSQPSKKKVSQPPVGWTPLQ